MAGIELDTTILKETRKSQGHTQESMALAIGISREAYCRIENSGRIRKLRAEKLAEALHVSVDYLTGADRGELLYSPFSCEWTDPRMAAEALPQRRLFNTDLELLNFLKNRITEERPHPVESGLNLAYPTAPLPTYSVSEGGQDCRLEIPLYESSLRPTEPTSLNFTFRELQHQEDIGFTWRPLTKWAGMTIEQELRSALDKYYPEYRFKGEHRGDKANFHICLRISDRHQTTQVLYLDNISVTRKFAVWFQFNLPESRAYLLPTDNVIALDFQPLESGSFDARLEISRAHVENYTRAPFPDDWKEAVLTTIGFNKTEGRSPALRIGKPENNDLPDLEHFRPYIPDSEIPA